MSIAPLIAVVILIVTILGIWAWVSLHGKIDSARSEGWVLFWIAPLAILVALVFIVLLALAWLLLVLIAGL